VGKNSASQMWLHPKLEKLQQLYKLHLFHGTRYICVLHSIKLHHLDSTIGQTQNLLLAVLVNNKFTVCWVTNLLNISHKQVFQYFSP
jgi:hypothetical protein